MNRLILATGIDHAYEQKALPYLKSLEQEANVDCLVFTLDYQAGDDLKTKLAGIEFRQLKGSMVKSPNSNGCLQHGGFLHALEDAADEDVIIFTDADIILQRPFQQVELEQFHSLKRGEVMVGYDRSQDQTLLDGAEILKPTCKPNELLKSYEGIEQMGVYNTGVIVAQLGAYRELYSRYNEHWPSFSPHFKHYAKQQWLLSFLIQKYFKPVILSGRIHSHGHHPLELRLSDEPYGELFCIGYQAVALRHAIAKSSNGGSSSVGGLEASLKLQRNRKRWWRMAFIVACLCIAIILILE